MLHVPDDFGFSGPNFGVRTPRETEGGDRGIVNNYTKSWHTSAYIHAFIKLQFLYSNRYAILCKLTPTRLLHFLYFIMQLSLKLDRLGRFLTWSRTKYKCMQGKRQVAVPNILVSIVHFKHGRWQMNLVEVADDFTTSLSSTCFVVGHDTEGCGHNNFTELTRRQQVYYPFLNII